MIGLGFNFPKYPADWDDIRAEVLDRDNHRCKKCGMENLLHIHHIIPLSESGTNDPENLITLCGHCHQIEHPHNITVDFVRETCLYCTQCKTKFKQEMGLYQCPDCGQFLRTMKIVNPIDFYDEYIPQFKRKRKS